MLFRLAFHSQNQQQRDRRSQCAACRESRQIRDILATLDAKQFRRCFVAWVAALTGMPSDVIAIDGKTSRRSKKGAQEAIHMVKLGYSPHETIVMRYSGSEVN